MKIGISSLGETLASEVDVRFGRAAYFIIYNTDDGSFSCVDNAQNVESMQGAGIQAAQNVINTGVQAVITPNCGPKAFRVLSSEGVKIFSCGEGKIKDTIDDFKNDKLVEIKQANVEGHWF